MSKPSAIWGVSLVDRPRSRRPDRSAKPEDAGPAGKENERDDDELLTEKNDSIALLGSEAEEERPGLTLREEHEREPAVGVTRQERSRIAGQPAAIRR